MIEQVVNQFITLFSWRLFFVKKTNVAHFLCEFVYVLVNSRQQKSL